VIGLRLNCLNPNDQRSNLILIGNTPMTRCRRNPADIFRLSVGLVRRAMDSESIQGHEWGAYVILGRYSVTEHVIAYGTRVLW
jgi:hypothetical protein